MAATDERAQGKGQKTEGKGLRADSISPLPFCPVPYALCPSRSQLGFGRGGRSGGRRSRSCGLAGRLLVELLHGVHRDVESGSGPDHTGISRAEQDVDALFLGDEIENREQLLLKFVLQLLRELVDLLLRVLLEALALDVLALDFFRESLFRGVAQRAALKLVLIVRERLALGLRFGLLLLHQGLDFRRQALAFDRQIGDLLQVHIGDLGARRKRSGRRCRRGRSGGSRRGRGWLGLSRRRLGRPRGGLGQDGSGAQREHERRGNYNNFHYCTVLS